MKKIVQTRGQGLSLAEFRQNLKSGFEGLSIFSYDACTPLTLTGHSEVTTMQQRWAPHSMPLSSGDDTSLQAWAVAGAYAEEGISARYRPCNGDWIDDRFEVIGRPIGKGDLGTVYKVRDVEGQFFALKRLSPVLGRHRRVLQQIQSDFRNLVDLRSPHLTAYYELFEAEGVLYLLMELVEGMSLQRLLKMECSLPTELAANVAIGVVRALDFLHIHRMLHREVKPENILLGVDGSVRLTDYGLRWVEYSTLSNSRNPLQTLHYLSPEQLRTRREGEELGPESDLYSVGAVLYEMLSGQRPYHSDKDQTLRELLEAKRKAEPAALADSVPEALRELVQQLMERSASERLSDTRHVLQWLAPFVPHPLRARERLGQWVHVHRDPHSEQSLARQKLRRQQLQEHVSSAPTIQIETPLEEPVFSDGHELLPFFLVTLLFFISLFVAGLLWEPPSQKGAGVPATTRAVPPVVKRSFVLGTPQKTVKKSSAKKRRKRRWRRGRKARKNKQWRRKRRWKKRRRRGRRRRRRR